MNPIHNLLLWKNVTFFYSSVNKPQHIFFSLTKTACTEFPIPLLFPNTAVAYAYSSSVSIVTPDFWLAVLLVSADSCYMQHCPLRVPSDSCYMNIVPCVCQVTPATCNIVLCVCQVTPATCNIVPCVCQVTPATCNFLSLACAK